MLLRLQAKQESGRVLQTVNTATSKVERAAANVPKHKGTTISTAFISQHLKSWQAHLEQISPLMEGEGIWWHKTEVGYKFAKGEDDPDCHPQGPQVDHFRSHSLDDVQSSKRKSWQAIVDNNVSLPTPLIYIYDDEGNSTGTQTFTCTSPPSEEQTAREQDCSPGPPSNIHVSASDQLLTDSPPGSTSSVQLHIVSDQYLTDSPPIT